MRELDLERAFTGAGTPTEDFQDQPGAIEHLRTPGLFEIALLNRRERAIHDNNSGIIGFDDPGNLFHLALADECRRANAAEQYDPRRDHVEVDGTSQPDGFLELRVGRAACGFAGRTLARHGPRTQGRLADPPAAALPAFRLAATVRAAIAPTRTHSNLSRRT